MRPPTGVLPVNILILGGTHEARMLAQELVEQGQAVTTSLAGRTRDPLPPTGALRVGSFGGVAGLSAYLEAAQVDRLVDATHPYAGQISRNAVAAAEQTGVPLVRILRAPWPEPEGGSWIAAPDAEAAAEALPPAARALLTIGHGGLQAFLRRDDCRFVVRTIEAPLEPLPAYASLHQSRPPFALEDEIALMRREEITHLISKNSGGGHTAAKLEAAHRLGVTIIMIDRPPYAPAPEVDSVPAAIAALNLAPAL
jgi:precorrin-6A/cobalt-precorrin-6A reductase